MQRGRQLSSKKPMKTTLGRREIIVNSRSIETAVIDFAEHEGG